MTIIQDLIPAGSKNRPGAKNPMRFITIHNTGNANKGANAKAHSIYIKGDSAVNAPMSWHYTVDETFVYQHLPDNETAYHAGDGKGPGNTQSIGIEICENSDGNLLLATENAARLCSRLCIAHDIPIENIIQHHFWSGKNCPQQLRNGKPYSWGTFLSKVNDYIQEIPPPPPPTTPEEITVNNAFTIGLLGDKVYWLGVITGTIIPKPEYVKTILDNAYNKIKSE